MNGIELHHATRHHRALRRLTSNIPALQPTIEEIVEETIRTELTKQETHDGTKHYLLDALSFFV